MRIESPPIDLDLEVDGRPCDRRNLPTTEGPCMWLRSATHDEFDISEDGRSLVHKADKPSVAHAEPKLDDGITEIRIRLDFDPNHTDAGVGVYVHKANDFGDLGRDTCKPDKAGHLTWQIGKNHDKLYSLNKVWTSPSETAEGWDQGPYKPTVGDFVRLRIEVKRDEVIMQAFTPTGSVRGSGERRLRCAREPGDDVHLVGFVYGKGAGLTLPSPHSSRGRAGASRTLASIPIPRSLKVAQDAAELFRALARRQLPWSFASREAVARAVIKRTVTVDSVDKTSFTQLIHVRGATSLTLTFTDTNLEATDMVVITAGDTSTNPHQRGLESDKGGHAQALALPGWQLGDYLEYDAEYATAAATASATSSVRPKSPAELKRADSTASLGGGGSGGTMYGAMEHFEQPTR